MDPQQQQQQQQQQHHDESVPDAGHHAQQQHPQQQNQQQQQPVIDLSKEIVITQSILPQSFGNLRVCAFSHIGTRNNQEDRFVFAPSLLQEYAFFGVFDGTVKEHASDWIHKHILPVLVQCPSFLAFHRLPLEEKLRDRKYLPEALRECYLQTDDQLLKWCAQMGYDYTACTSVTVLLHLASGVMYVAHVGDSHAVIGSERPSTVAERLGKPQPIFALDSALRLTMEHKPNQPGERARIERCGGRLIYLKNNRPFIRGGDFGQRDHAMQLNYSRAFGGKDLKMFGLSAEPDLAVVPLKLAPEVLTSARRAILRRDGLVADEEAEERELQRLFQLTNGNGEEHPDPLYTRCILLGSDGLWDVMAPNSAVNTAAAFHEYYDRVTRGSEALPPGLGPYDKADRPLCSAERLVQCALSNEHQKGSTDNVTAICVFVEPAGADWVARMAAAKAQAQQQQQQQQQQQHESGMEDDGMME